MEFTTQGLPLSLPPDTTKLFRCSLKPSDPPSKTHFSNPIKQHTMSNNPLFSISLNILNQLKHLKISEPINISKSKFIAGGGFSDVFKTNHVFPDSPTKRAIAIKRLRFYMKEDIVMVRTKVIPSHILI